MRVGSHRSRTDAGQARVRLDLASIHGGNGRALCTYARWGWLGLVTGAVLAFTLSALAAIAVWIVDGRGAARRGGLRALTAGLLGKASIGLVAIFEIVGACVVLLLAGFAPRALVSGTATVAWAS